MKVILASASPRRLALLRQIGMEPIVHPADFDEVDGAGADAAQVVLANAVGKRDVVIAELGDDEVVIAADTVVVVDNVILGKPADEAAAKAMLASLSGRSHQVMTGVAVGWRGKRLARVCVTEVSFRQLAEQEIAAYVATGEPLDKAGAYGIQGRGAVLVDEINGCYNNVVGLPLSLLYRLLKELGAIGVEGIH